MKTHVRGSSLFLALLLCVLRLSGAEPLGPSSHRTGIVISEIMYHPIPPVSGVNPEFVEFFNSSPYSEDISGYSIDGDISFVFPSGSIIPANGYRVVVDSTSGFNAIYPGLAASVLGSYSHHLSHSSGTLQLRNKSGAILLEASFKDSAPWPISADGEGPSLVLSRPSLGEGDPAAWSASTLIGGSPAAPEPVAVGPLESIVINELLANGTGGCDQRRRKRTAPHPPDHHQ